MDQLSIDNSKPGYVYRTVQLSVIADASVVGDTTSTTCTLRNSTSLEPANTFNWLEYFGLSADQIWEGPEIPGIYSGTNRPSGLPLDPDNCVVPLPDAPGVAGCTNGKHGIFQDDAAVVTFGGSIIHCNGMNNPPISGQCGGYYIYEKGFNPPSGTAWRGAGFFNFSPVLLSDGSSTGSVPDVQINASMRNTWTGNYKTTLTLTLRYPKKAVTLIASCPNKNVTVNIDAPPSSSVSSNYFVDGAFVGSALGTSFIIPMVSYDQTVAHDVRVTSSINGAPQVGNTTYGPCASSTGSTNAPCPNFASTPWSFDPAPGRGAQWQSDSYNATIMVGGQVVQSAGSNSGSVPYNSVPDQYKDADIHNMTGTGTWTSSWGHYETQYYSYDSDGDGVDDSIGSYQIQVTDGSASGAMVYRNPNNYPSDNRGCYDRYFDLTASFPAPRLEPDQEEPTRYYTSGSITAKLQTQDSKPYSSHALKVNSTAKISVSGATSGVSSRAYDFNRDAPPYDTYGFNDSTNPLGLTISWPIKQPPTAGDQYCSQFNLTKARGIVDVFGVPVGPTGSNPPPAAFSDLDAINLDGSCQHIVDRPYLKGFMGDIRAVDILAWSRSLAWTSGANGSGFRGSSSEYGIFAMNNISQDTTTRGQFSASLRNQSSSPIPIPAKGLTFANTDADTYGGALGGSQQFYDYFDKGRISGLTGHNNYRLYINDTPGQVNSIPLQQGQYLATGVDTTNPETATSCPWGRTATAASNTPCYAIYSPAPATKIVIRRGQHITLFVDGDLKIKSNIEYEPGPYTNRQDIPYLTVIVRGSIYIHNEVTRIDGLYIAQATSSASPPALGVPPEPGNIYTCTKAFNKPLALQLAVDPGRYEGFSAADIPATCAQRLVVNGALIAEKQIEFWRTYSSLRNSRNNTTNPERSSVLSGNNNAAEEINFIPEILFGEPALASSGSSSSLLDFESFSSLPPIY